MSTLHFGDTIDRIDVPRCPGCARHGSDPRCYCGGAGYLLECAACEKEMHRPEERERDDGTAINQYRVRSGRFDFYVCSEECLGVSVAQLVADHRGEMRRAS